MSCPFMDLLDVTSILLVKGDGHFISGSGGLDSGVEVGRRLDFD